MSAYSCLYPVPVKTPQGIAKVSCGKCAACLNRKSSTLSMQCNVEESLHKFCYFVTLTYSDDNLPMCRVVRHLDRWVFVDASSRSDCVGELGIDGTPVLAACECSRFDPGFFSLYYGKLNLHPEYRGLIPYLSRRDCQLFMKRLRKRISKYTDEKIRYYVCGEYGPKHFRPHYHFLLFFDSPAIAASLRDDILSCWKYGRVDVQPSKGKCGGYVSKYINSFSNLSAVQRLPAFRPFSSHSRHFASSFYEALDKKIPEVRYSDYLSAGLVVNGRVRQVFPWLAHEVGVFPKCFGFGPSTGDLRLFVYTAIGRVSKEYGSDRVSYLASRLYDDYFSRRVRAGSWLSEFLSCFRARFELQPVKESTFSSILYTSSKFFKLCSRYRLSPALLLRAIENYYSSKDYYRLCSQLREQSDFIAQSGVSFLPFLLCWYDNFEPIPERSIKEYDAYSESVQCFAEKFRHVTDAQRLRLEAMQPYYYPKPIMDYFDSIGLSPYFLTEEYYKDNILYWNFYSVQKKIYMSSVKHKKLNDLNNIFCYGKHNEHAERPQQGSPQRLRPLVPQHLHRQGRRASPRHGQGSLAGRQV